MVKVKYIIFYNQKTRIFCMKVIFFSITNAIDKSLTEKISIKKPLLLCLFLFYAMAVRPMYAIISSGYTFVENSATLQQTIIHDIYPAGLELRIQNGRVSTNVREPYFISFSQSQFNQLLQPGKSPGKGRAKVRVLTIDTKAKVEDFEKYQSYMLLTGNSLVYLNSGRITVTPLDRVTNLVINKEVLQRHFSSLNQYVEENKTKLQIGVFLFLLLVLHGLVFLFGLAFLFTLLWLAFIIRILLKIVDIPSSYANCMRSGMSVFLIVWIGIFIPALFFSYEAALIWDHAVFLLALSITYLFIYQKKYGKTHSITKKLFIIVAHPLLIAKDVFFAKKSVVKKIFYTILLFGILFSTWNKAITETKKKVYNGLIEYGLIDKPITVPVYGTSMYPTVKNGEKITLGSPKKFPIQRGDIISFRNEETAPSHYLKRVVGMPGDDILIKGGHVYINNELIKEPYVKYGPTYGNEYILECRTYKVPSQHYLALGDNRVVSFDSRAIGFVSQKDIDGVIKSPQADVLTSTSPKANLRAKLDIDLFLKKYNRGRENMSLSPLTIHKTLDKIAENKAAYISSHIGSGKNDSYVVETVLKQEGYVFSATSEFITYGYLDEEQILNQIHEQNNAFLDFYSDTFSEIGIGQSQMSINECKMPIIVIIIARPDRPTYSSQTIQYWQKELATTKMVLNEVNSFVGFPGMDKDNLAQIRKNVEEGYGLVSEINRQIRGGEWIDEKLVKRYDTLVKETSPQIDKLYEKAVDTKQSSFSTTSDNVTGEEMICINRGLVTVEGDVSAKVIKVWQSKGRIYVRVHFSNNFGLKTEQVSPYLVVMKAKEITGFPNPAIQSTSLKPGETVVYDFNYQEFPDKPYRFIYMGADQQTELAECQ